jgi:hypothetical protein
MFTTINSNKECGEQTGHQLGLQQKEKKKWAVWMAKQNKFELSVW